MSKLVELPGKIILERGFALGGEIGGTKDYS